jgi:1-aminocyclopropane-1-carboxylate deaminase/D-cysteine desulfhydrase-like pyridoxal-dependent ACC family enzyme
VAGLLEGLRGGAAAPERLVAVRVVERPIAGEGPVRRLAEATRGRFLGEESAEPIPLEVAHGQIGAGYGFVTNAALAAVAAAARVGLVLEPTYTGKAMAQLLADADAGLLDGKRVLFVQTFAGR